jgi:uncharacterized RDD family membrane protein YckC
LQKTANKFIKKPGIGPETTPGFLRRIMAVCYDAALLLAVLFFATALSLPINSGQAFASNQYFYHFYLLSVSFFFYGWFWTHGGQTLGLRSWKIKLCRLDGGDITWRLAALRFAAAGLSWLCFGLGFFWCVFDKNRLCWHDYLSNTRLSTVDRENT